MKFIVALTALASVASAAVMKRQELTQNFEFQSFKASCDATSNLCTVEFNLNGTGVCSATQSPFTATDAAGVSYKKISNIGETYCQTTTWIAVRTAEGGYEISATNDKGLSGSSTILPEDFTVANGVETYTGNGIVILYGAAI